MYKGCPNKNNSTLTPPVLSVLANQKARPATHMPLGCSSVSSRSLPSLLLALDLHIGGPGHIFHLIVHRLIYLPLHLPQRWPTNRVSSTSFYGGTLYLRSINLSRSVVRPVRIAEYCRSRYLSSLIAKQRLAQYGRYWPRSLIGARCV